jgi:hypothetical protein
VYPRQTAEPVLYIGATTAERVNIGHESGRVVAIVPSALNEQGEVAPRAGLASLGEAAIDAARAKGGELLRAVDREALRHAAAELIRQHSPQERELADLILAESSGDAKNRAPQ